jgi:hypothetical protein
VPAVVDAPPADPADPGDPAAPADPALPAAPAEPALPAAPALPADPALPVDPALPADPLWVDGKEIGELLPPDDPLLGIEEDEPPLEPPLLPPPLLPPPLLPPLLLPPPLGIEAPPDELLDDCSMQPASATVTATASAIPALRSAGRGSAAGADFDWVIGVYSRSPGRGTGRRVSRSIASGDTGSRPDRRRAFSPTGPRPDPRR